VPIHFQAVAGFLPLADGSKPRRDEAFAPPRSRTSSKRGDQVSEVFASPPQYCHQADDAVSL